MRPLLLLSLSAALACAPSSEPQQFASTRQAFATTPDFMGPTQGAQLGRSLTACPGTGHALVAGAPGTGTLLLTADAGTFAAQGNQLGRAVACTSEVFAASTVGIQRVANAGWSAVSATSTSSLATSDFDGTLPVLAGQTGSVRYLNPVTGLDMALPLASPSVGFGTAVAWAPDAPRFAVGSPASGLVDVYDYAGGMATFRFELVDMHVEFGRVIVFGNVSPTPGTEIIVAARNIVQVFDQNGGILWTLPSSSLGFGASLAIEQGYAPGLDALWIGDPTLDQLQRFIGTAGSALPGPLVGVSFGASMSIKNGLLAVGAPDYPNLTARKGAVFLQTMVPTTVFGEAQLCSAGASCRTSTCEVGTCLGGVFCSGTSNPTSACLPEDFCVQGTCVMPDGGLYADAGVDAGPGDAGTPDAGGPQVDAGTTPADAGVRPDVDAGMPDAGEVDAGRVDLDAGFRDAGVLDAGTDAGTHDAGAPEKPDAGALGSVAFSAGCSQSGAWPLTLLALWLGRRARRGEPSVAPMT